MGQAARATIFLCPAAAEAAASIHYAASRLLLSRLRRVAPKTCLPPRSGWLAEEGDSMDGRDGLSVPAQERARVDKKRGEVRSRCRPGLLVGSPGSSAPVRLSLGSLGDSSWCCIGTKSGYCLRNRDRGAAAPAGRGYPTSAFSGQQPRNYHHPDATSQPVRTSPVTRPY